MSWWWSGYFQAKIFPINLWFPLIPAASTPCEYAATIYDFISAARNHPHTADAEPCWLDHHPNLRNKKIKDFKPLIGGPGRSGGVAKGVTNAAITPIVVITPHFTPTPPCHPASDCGAANPSSSSFSFSSSSSSSFSSLVWWCRWSFQWGQVRRNTTCAWRELAHVVRWTKPSPWLDSLLSASTRIQRLSLCDFLVLLPLLVLVIIPPSSLWIITRGGWQAREQSHTGGVYHRRQHAAQRTSEVDSPYTSEFIINGTVQEQELEKTLIIICATHERAFFVAFPNRNFFYFFMWT